MFNDKYGLTDAVLQGRKTMTRRIIADNDEIDAMLYARGSVEKKMEYLLGKSRYKIGEVVAVAQSYEYMANSGYLDGMMETSSTFKKEYCGAGWNNKMFVRADLMPHQIRITNIKVERLQDISEEDCLLEGVVRRKEMHPRQEWEPEYTFGDGKFHAQNPRAAFAALIDKSGVGGKGTWERNPWCVAYTFELVGQHATKLVKSTRP